VKSNLCATRRCAWLAKDDAPSYVEFHDAA
jgi:hypothetical protein